MLTGNQRIGALATSSHYCTCLEFGLSVLHIVTPQVVHTVGKKQKRCRTRAVQIDLFIASWSCKDWSKMKLKGSKKSLDEPGTTSTTFWALIATLEFLRPITWCGENLDDIAEISSELCQGIQQVPIS